MKVICVVFVVLLIVGFLFAALIDLAALQRTEDAANDLN